MAASLFLCFLPESGAFSWKSGLEVPGFCYLRRKSQEHQVPVSIVAPESEHQHEKFPILHYNERREISNSLETGQLFA